MTRLPIPRPLTRLALVLAAGPRRSGLPTNLNTSNAVLALSAEMVETPILVGGRWNGHPLDLAAMEELVATYNPEAQPAPIKLTHQEVKDEAKKKAYGWVKRLRLGDWTPPGAKAAVKTLFATLAFTDEGRQAVQSGAYRMKSLEAWPREHPSNPTPGKWTFRALALLGAESPGCPNLTPLTLAAGEEDIETPVLILQDLDVSGGAGLRPTPPQSPHAGSGKPCPGSSTPNPGGHQPPQKGDPMDPNELAALQAKATENAALHNQVAELTAKLAATAKAQETATIQTRLDGLLKEGKLTPAQVALAAPIALSLADEGVVTLAEGKTSTPRAAFFQLLEGLETHGLLTPSGAPATRPAALAAEDQKAFSAAVQKHLDAGKPYDQAVELAARDLDTPKA